VLFGQLEPLMSQIDPRKIIEHEHQQGSQIHDHHLQGIVHSWAVFSGVMSTTRRKLVRLLLCHTRHSLMPLQVIMRSIAS